MNKLRVGLLGAGGINSLVAESLMGGAVPEVEVVAVAGSGSGSISAAALAQRLGAHPVSPEELGGGGCDLVLEAAGRAAVAAHVPALWQSGVSTIVMSVGALIDPEVEAAYRRALAHGVHVLLPSGGIGGLDAVRALAAGGGLSSARITSTKAPAGLRGAPYLERNGIQLPDDRAMTVFRGSAREAVEGFPANVNVAVALSLAGLGPNLTEVVVRSDPAATFNSQFIEAEGEAGRIEVSVVSKPSPTNPRTSRLAAASAVAALREAVARLQTEARRMSLRGGVA